MNVKEITSFFNSLKGILSIWVGLYIRHEKSAGYPVYGQKSIRPNPSFNEYINLL